MNNHAGIAQRESIEDRPSDERPHVPPRRSEVSNPPPRSTEMPIGNEQALSVGRDPLLRKLLKGKR